MALSLGFTSPMDLLGKAERNLSELESAISAQDEGRIGDILYDFSVSITSLKDWLKVHPSTSYTGTDVETFASKSTALSSFRDIANANKHRFITRYQPSTIDTTISAMPSYVVAPISSALKLKKPFLKQPFRVKIIRADGARLETSALARTAIAEWRAFMMKHGVK